MSAATSAANVQAGSGSAGGSQAMPSPHKRDSMPKRRLIESACSACRKRKSKCDGVRPSCARCQALNTTCQYQVEAGESRWSALRRKNHDLERERDNYRILMSLIQSRPEAEAQEIYRHIRANNHGGDVGALLHAIREVAITSGAALLTPVDAAPTTSFHRGNMAVVNLPPLRSVVDVPPLGMVHAADFLTLQQRRGRIMSADSGPYSSPGTSDSRSSVSQQDLPYGRV
ncbi:hypothetical protein B0A48_18863 [Cryoendolithus antarcticus]|uniref:Zn(2)-C6 fungal-type domain-containing protein n=2 Tax=Cryoendolithus antarcticus TaxID=1507870 RepID=A0A1V8S8F9_9PEZI|nr:hypothetical protein B0A48_18863 [Cryoendolithus antarcticus]